VPKPQLTWFKSSYSGSPDNDCVECAIRPNALLVRDSKAPEASRLRFTQAAWVSFISALDTDRIGTSRLSHP
jgi:hypothetical protein